MKLSIVIPYHNADAWVGAMLDSLLDQDLPSEDYEIIVVDDGSTEEPVTLRRYAAAHPQITYHRKENAGQAEARNVGMDLARGKWIWFCDSDDYVEPQILGRLLAIAEGRELEMLWFDAVYVHEDRPVPAHSCDWEAVSATQTGWDYLLHPPAKVGMAVWRFLIRRDVLTRTAIRFHPVTYMEGRWFISELMPQVQRVAHVAACLYFYVQHDSSVLHRKKRMNYVRYASDMDQYLTVVTEMLRDPALTGEQRTYLRLRRDYEAYRLLGNVFRYCPVSFSETYWQRLKDLGAWPVMTARGDRSERMTRRLMNRHGLWMAGCRLYHRLHRLPAQVLGWLCVALLVAGCSHRVAPAGSAGADTAATKAPDAAEVAALVQWSAPNEVFYKDIFLDAGIGLTPRTTLYAADSLGLSLEGVSFPRSNAKPEEFALQTAILSGSPEDRNGRLLYPDGQPRYRLLLVNGGKASEHSASLDDAAREHMRQFVRAGGSYVGFCAGAFFGSSGHETQPVFPGYLQLMPTPVRSTGLKSVYTGMYVAEDSPLWAYADFGKDRYIQGIRHNGGCFPESLPEGGEVLATYDYPGKASVHRQPSAWAYKADAHTGRVVLEGSHPEEVRNGERLYFTEALIRYAADGIGTVSLKGLLENGRPWTMDQDTMRLGDRQCHHYAVYVPAGACDLRFTVESPADCDLVLRLCRDSFAFPSRAVYASGEIGASQQLALDALEPGVWYVSVQCLTTVTVEKTEYGQRYTGRTDVLNGVPYTIGVSWNLREHGR